MLRKLEEWKKSPTSSIEAAQTMKRNMAQGIAYTLLYLVQHSFFFVQHSAVDDFLSHKS